MARKTGDYEVAEGHAVEVVDCFTDLEIAVGWGSTYKSATRMDDIGIAATVRAVMPPRTNKVLRKNYDPYTRVGSLQVMRIETIGAFVKLFCKCAGVRVPDGRPR